MPVPSQCHYGFHSFPVVDWFCLFIYLWVMTFPLGDCSEFVKFVITLICTFSFGPCVVRSSIYRFWLSPWVSPNSSYGLNLLSDAEQNITVFWWGKYIDLLIFEKKVIFNAHQTRRSGRSSRPILAEVALPRLQSEISRPVSFCKSLFSYK